MNELLTIVVFLGMLFTLLLLCMRTEAVAVQDPVKGSLMLVLVLVWGLACLFVPMILYVEILNKG